MKTLADLFEYDPATLKVRSRESTQREFKRSYDPVKLPKYLQTLAAFSNHDGGSLIFGVSEKPRLLVGIEEVGFPDTNDWQKQLRSHFEPAILVSTESFHEKSKTILLCDS